MQRSKKKRTVSLAHDNEQPRVLHVSTADSWRGGEQQLAYLIGELQERDVPQIVVCRKEGAFHRYCEQQGIEHVALKKRSAFDPFFSWHLAKLSREIEADLVHVHDSHGHTLAFLASLLFRSPVPIVVSRRVDFPLKGVLSRWKYGHASIAAIICVSEAIRQVLEHDLGSRDQIHVVHSGIDPSRFPERPVEGRLRKEYGIPEDVALVGNNAALAPHKDYFTFVDTVSLLVQEGVRARYFIIGEGPSRKEIEQYIRREGLEEHIILTGFREDIPIILPELDVFLMTSETEGLGTSLLDAFCCRVPVVATDAGGIPELVEHGITGYLAKVRDPVSLKEGVLEALSPSKKRNLLIENAFERSKMHTKERVAEKTLDIYRCIY